MSSERLVFIKISMSIIFKYVVSVAAKMSVKFRGSIRETPKNRSKFKKNVIFDLDLLFINVLALFTFWMGFVGNT